MKPTKKRKAKSVELPFKELARFLKAAGWTPLVIGGCHIQQRPGDFRFNYDLVIHFTGGPKKEASNGRQRPKEAPRK